MDRDPRKTTAAWAKRFGEILALISSEYRRNRNETGKFIEYVRPLDSGLWLSQNCIAIRGHYYHCCALLFTLRKLSSFLLSPFYAGARFDHNRGIQDQFFKEFGAHDRAGLHASHGWRTRAEELVLSTCRRAEAELVPVYLDALAAGASNLGALFERALLLLGLSEEELTSQSAAAHQPPRHLRDVTALTVARWTELSDDLLTNTVLAYLEDFKAVRDELPGMLTVVHGLRRRP